MSLPYTTFASEVAVSPRTVRNWLNLLCRHFYLFRVPPWSRGLNRALKQEGKYYLWDWTWVSDPAARFENLVAAHLMKYVHLYRDAHGIDAGLYHLKDLEKRTADFLVTWEGEPWFIVQCLPSPVEGGATPIRDASRALRQAAYYRDRVGAETAFGVVPPVADGGDARGVEVDEGTGVRVLAGELFLMGLC